MEFKEVAHLYTGCKIMADGHIRTMHEVCVGKGWQVTCYDYNPSSFFIEQVTPILRRITSMTQIEAQQVFAICYKQVYDYEPMDVKFRPLQTNENVIGLKGDEAKHGGGEWNYGLTICRENIEFSVDGAFMSISVLPIYIYLLSKSFDLFDFIEDRKALEEVTIQSL
jgi:hypothetical protein